MYRKYVSFPIYQCCRKKNNEYEKYKIKMLKFAYVKFMKKKTKCGRRQNEEEDENEWNVDG